MDVKIVDFLVSPFTQFFIANERLYWLYLLSAGWIAYVLFVLRKNNDVKVGQQVGTIVFPRAILWHSSAINDYLFFYTDMLFRGTFIVALFSSLSGVVSGLTEANLQVLMPSFNGRLEGLYGRAFLVTLLLALVVDAALYMCHFLQHKIPLLWEFHKVHHSAQVMTPITVFRMHPVDNILVFSLGGLLFGLALGCANFLMGHGVSYYNVAGVNVILVLFYLLGFNLRHSHVWWSWGAFLSRVFISPAQHQIHHSAEPEHFNKNLGFTFAIWDGLFGTLYVPKQREVISFGLGETENEKFSTFWSLYLMPFISVFNNFNLKMLGEPKRYASALVFLSIVVPAIYLNTIKVQPLNLPVSVYLEDMTWQEVRDTLENGTTTVLVPTGGTEQNGPHVVLGKHNYIVKYTTGKIAEMLGKTLVAPVMNYVPEGVIAPADGHMKFPGTLSISEGEFEAVLESTVRSLKQHGFTTIALIGDSGGNQAGQEKVAEYLTRLWKDEGVRVLNINKYYDTNFQTNYLLNNGFSLQQIGGHAGIRDTSELMAVLPGGVRSQFKVDHSKTNFIETGADGDASEASIFLGHILLDLKIEAAVKQIRAALVFQ